MRPLILSSSSVPRKGLLSRLHMPFSVYVPDIDETAKPGESAIDLVRRLSEEKARIGGVAHSHATIIGADQVGVLDGRILTKPSHKTEAMEMLLSFSGRAVRFYSGLCVYVPETDFCKVIVVPTVLHFRVLSETQVARYIALEPPYACAGALQVEGLGIALIARIESDDPTAIIGLPLIALVDLLHAADSPVLCPLPVNVRDLTVMLM